jgi:hypothetical protein
MNRKLFYITLAALLALLLSVSGAVAQEPELEGALQSEGDISIEAALNSRISYQGILQEDGEPVTGGRNMNFNFYDDGSCSGSPLETVNKSGVPVNEGLFSVQLDVTHGNFNGQGLWLEVEVGGTDLGCQEVLPAPYALSLRPGAVVSGTVNSGSIIRARNTAITSGTGLYGTALKYGVQGWATGSDDAYGVLGVTTSDSDGVGVYGFADSPDETGINTGVFGYSDSIEGRGVRGYVNAASGTTYGVFGRSSNSPDGRGVYGEGGKYGLEGIATASSGVTSGVYGKSNNSPDGRGVYGEAAKYGLQGLATATSGTDVYGVAGQSMSSDGTGVYGTAPKYGLRGWASASSGTTYGVYGASDSSTGYGVYGKADAESGITYGVYGKSDSTTGYGVFGETAGGYGVYGKSNATSGTNYGVYGEASMYGVYGKGTASSGNVYGVYGITSRGFDGYGVYGKNTGLQGTGVYGEGGVYGLQGKSSGSFGDDAGVYGEGSRGVHGVGSSYGVYGYCNGCTGVYADGYTGVNAGGSTAVEATGSTYGVNATSAAGTAVYGYSGSLGVHGETWGSGGYGVEAENTSSNGVALIARSGTNGHPIEAWRGSSEQVFRVEALSGDVYADGAYHCGYDDGGNASYIDENMGCMHDLSPADFAEVMPVVSDPEPGDVLAIGPDGQLSASTEPYQSSVVGVYSTRPSYVGGAANLGKEGYAPLAVVGLVPVKASAENGPIAPGDLLVSSSTPGHAMKAGSSPPVGTVVGKALEGLDEGSGMIQMLVMLQ